MKIKVKIHPNSSQEKVEKISKESFEVWIKQKPIDGKANEYLIKFLKKYFGRSVKLQSGFNSKFKILELE